MKKGTYLADSSIYGISIEKPITLIGESKENTIIKAPASYGETSTVKISADKVTLSGFTINGNGVCCICIEDSYSHMPTGDKIISNNIQNGSWGIITYGSTNTLTG